MHGHAIVSARQLGNSARRFGPSENMSSCKGTRVIVIWLPIRARALVMNPAHDPAVVLQDLVSRDLQLPWSCACHHPLAACQVVGSAGLGAVTACYEGSCSCCHGMPVVDCVRPQVSANAHTCADQVLAYRGRYVAPFQRDQPLHAQLMR